MIKAVIDTNVFISSLISSDGICAKIITYLFLNRFIMLISREILKEFREVSLYPKIKKLHQLREEKIDEYLDSILAFSSLVSISSIPEVIKEDPKDDIILACAESGDADYIVSGDKHLLNLKEYKRIPVIKASEFIEILEIVPEA